MGNKACLFILKVHEKIQTHMTVCNCFVYPFICKSDYNYRSFVFLHNGQMKSSPFLWSINTEIHWFRTTLLKVLTTPSQPKLFSPNLPEMWIEVCRRLFQFKIEIPCACVRVPDTQNPLSADGYGENFVTFWQHKVTPQTQGIPLFGQEFSSTHLYLPFW